ncbi:hypothetical protein Hanom_Chr03g00215551 [Helianthus anomalus]
MCIHLAFRRHLLEFWKTFFKKSIATSFALALSTETVKMFSISHSCKHFSIAFPISTPR